MQTCKKNRSLLNEILIALAFVGGALFASTAAYADAENDALIDQGRIIYDETAGGVGCAACHGLQATGDPDAGAPFIRGAGKSEVDAALDGAVPMMGFIELNKQERKAIVAYLGYLTYAEEVLLDPEVAAGKVLFEETAGGVGCQECHGIDAQGDIGPNIVGKETADIYEQLLDNPAMGFIKLTRVEVDSVAAYLNYLHDLETH